MSVMNLRLNKEEIDRISKLSAQKKEAKSEIIRELLNEGWMFYWLKLYSAGKVSVGKMAEELDLSVNEALDLLAEFGIEFSIRYDDYLSGFENLKKL
ncbi:MAG: ribbon-helix-helix domain-containing protein [Actinobacteria bacterium]|nr:ribbon-helix-helix domain-containing protein [Actinomycetota bacterium]